jgi:hypothetical protein
MSFDPSTGQLSGTPELAIPTTTYTVTVTDNNGASSFKTFDLTVNPGAATQISAANSITTLTALQGSTVTARVVVKDLYGNPKSGVAVTFAVTSGGGSITGAAQVTNANGVAAVGSWTLGPVAGTNTLTATSAGLSGSPVTFTANTYIPPGTAIQLLVNPVATPTFTVSGGNVVIPINVDMSNRGSDDLASVSVIVSWDPTRYEFVSDAPGNGPGWSVFAKNLANVDIGQFELSSVAVAGAINDFTLHNITLKPISTGGGASVTATVTAALNQGSASIVLPVRNLTATINP